MNVLVACEESQRVCTAFRELGHNAFSCDIQECSGGHPEWHIKVDALSLLNPQFFESDLSFGIHFNTCDGVPHFVAKWDLIIAFPPCTYMCKAGARPSNTSKAARGAGGGAGVARTAIERSKTFRGIAASMAKQWG